MMELVIPVPIKPPVNNVATVSAAIMKIDRLELNMSLSFIELLVASTISSPFFSLSIASIIWKKIFSLTVFLNFSSSRKKINYFEHFLFMK